MRVPSSTIHGATLSFRAASIETSLDQILARLPKTGDRPQLEPPTIGVAAAREPLGFEPVRDLALKELLAHAKDGTAQATIPLRPSSFKLGPLTLEIVPGSAVVADVAVQDGRVVYEACTGRVEPPVALPLGFTFKGIHLDDRGHVHARIGGLPDINISRLLLRGFRVPETLAEALDLAFAQAARPDEPQVMDAIVVEGGVDTEPRALPPVEERPLIEIVKEGIVVVALGVTPTQAPLSLGSLGTTTLGEATRFDVRYAADRLAVTGHVDVRTATLMGEGFRIEGLRGAGALSLVVARVDGQERISLDVTGADGAVDGAMLGLRDGTRLHLDASVMERLALTVERTAGALTFKAGAPRLRGALRNGVVVAHVGQQVVPVRVADVDVEGSFEIAHDHFQVDVQVNRGSVATSGFVVDVGLLRLDLAAVEARARGRLRAGTDLGAAFSGELVVAGDVVDGALRLGPIQAGLASGTRAALTITELAGGADGLDALRASGDVRLVVRSGSLPVGRDATLGFSRGAEGTLLLDVVEAKRGAPWPTVEGSLALSAQSDACALDPMLELPAGQARVAVGRFSLDDVGLLHLVDVAVDLASE